MSTNPIVNRYITPVICVTES